MNTNRLIAGQQAPDFTTTDIYDNIIALQDYKNKKLLSVFFYMQVARFVLQHT